MAASRPSRAPIIDDHADDDLPIASPSAYSAASYSDDDEADDDDDAPCESAFDRLPDEIIQQYVYQTCQCPSARSIPVPLPVTPWPAMQSAANV